MITYKIEKNVELPGKCGVNGYPFQEMCVGDSFLVPINGRSAAKTLNVVSSAAAYWTRKSGFKFTCRTTADGVRVWRIS